jgi:hypothetical protein
MNPDSLNPSGNPPGNDRRRRASEILRDLARNWPRERLSLGDIEAALGDRGFGLMLLVFTLPALIPGIAAIAAIPLLLLAIQLMLGLPRPWLPRAILNRATTKAEFERTVDRLMPHLQRVERVLKPRLTLFSGAVAERLIGLVCLVLALLLPLPWPFGNLLVAAPLILLALALIERDGLLALAGFVVAAICGGVLIGGTWIALRESLRYALEYLGMSP